VLAAVVVAVMVLSLSFMSPAAMVAVRHNLGSSVAAAAPGSSSSTASSGAAAGGLAAASPPVARKEKEQARRPPLVLFNFGDSNSDTGGVAAAGGIRIMPPEGRTYFHHPTGRLSDGRVIIDFICEFHPILPLIKLTINSPLLLAFGKINKIIPKCYTHMCFRKKKHMDFFFISLWAPPRRVHRGVLPLLLLAHVRTHRVVQRRRHDEATAARRRAGAVLKPIARWPLNICRCAVWSTMVGCVALSAERF